MPIVFGIFQLYEVPTMFSDSDIRLMSMDRFRISFILPDHGIAEIQSVSTSHTWMIRTSKRRVDLYHKHKSTHPFHFHYRGKNVTECILEIIGHDEFELNGRVPAVHVMGE